MSTKKRLSAHKIKTQLCLTIFVCSKRASWRASSNPQKGRKQQEITAQSATGKIAAAFCLQIATLQQQQHHNSDYISDSNKNIMHITNSIAEKGVLLKKSVPGIEVALLWGAKSMAGQWLVFRMGPPYLQLKLLHLPLKLCNLLLLFRRQ